MADKEVAVITDAVADSYFLPVWADYYGGQFGRENLFVFSYDDNVDAARLGIGHVMRMKVDYHNGVRVWLFNDFTAELLGRYKCVVRTDVDEFLIADPKKFNSLRRYVAEGQAPFVTALGLDVMQMPDEPKLDFGARPLLAQRRYALKTTDYSKTCIVRRPVGWGLGFHTTESPPAFGDLYLFHMRFADVQRRFAWLDFMAETCKSDPDHLAHFKATRLTFENMLRDFQALPKQEGPDAIRDREFVRRMESAARKREDGQFDYAGIPAADIVLTEIPPEFRQLL